MIEMEKLVQFRCPQSLFDRFIALYPWHGAMSIIVRRGIEKAIEEKMLLKQLEAPKIEEIKDDTLGRDSKEVGQKPSLNDTGRDARVQQTAKTSSKHRRKENKGNKKQKARR